MNIMIMTCNYADKQTDDMRAIQHASRDWNTKRRQANCDSPNRAARWLLLNYVRKMLPKQHV